MTIHTGYSFKSAVGHLPDVIQRVKAIGWTVAPIADRCSTFGFTRWRTLCEANDLRPVYGVELPVTPALGKKVPMDFWTFLAIDDLKDLHRLINLATTNAGTDGNDWPLLTYAQAHAAEGVIKISGHAVLLDHVQADDVCYYFGLTPATAKGLVSAAMTKGLHPIAASCNAYPTLDDKNLYRVAMTRYVKRKETWITMGGDTQTTRSTFFQIKNTQMQRASSPAWQLPHASECCPDAPPPLKKPACWCRRSRSPSARCAKKVLLL
jgi:hypothetical protein